MTGILKQIPIDWTQAVHNIENNKFSQKHLDKNRHKFVGQAAMVLTMLQQGLKVTADFVKDVHHIRHLGRRICDLGEKGSIDIDREWMRDEEGEQVDLLVYFLPENRKSFTEKKWIIDRPRWWYSDKYTPTAIINEILKNKNEKK
jgi:hypothetical protein